MEARNATMQSKRVHSRALRVMLNLALSFGGAGLLCLVALFKLVDYWIDRRPDHVDSIHNYVFRVENHGAVFFVSPGEGLLWQLLTYGGMGLLLLAAVVGVVIARLESGTPSRK